MKRMQAIRAAEDYCRTNGLSVEKLKGKLLCWISEVLLQYG